MNPLLNPPLAHGVNAEARTRAMAVWNETRELPGNTKATVTAFVVPMSGVGWVDCEWSQRPLGRERLERKLPEMHRVLADWSGKDHAAMVRDVIPLSDEWFKYCGEQAEREVAVKALAGAPPTVQRSAPNNLQPGTFGPMGPTVNPPLGGVSSQPLQETMQQLQELHERLEEQQSKLAQGQAMTEWDRLYRIAGHFGASPPPDAGGEVVEGVLAGFTGQAVFGSTESSGNGLGYAGDSVAKSEMGR